MTSTKINWAALVTVPASYFLGKIGIEILTDIEWWDYTKFAVCILGIWILLGIEVSKETTKY